MASLLGNVSVPEITSAPVMMTDWSFNLTTGPVSGRSLAPLCNVCSCGFVNRTLAVVFMISLAFAIVVGNVITLTVMVQTRQSRSPQGYLKGE